MSWSTAKCRALRFGVFEADPELRELRKHGLRIKLASQPFQALVLLLNRSGEVVTRDELRKSLWPEEPWGDHDQGLNKAINKIREALNESAGNPRFLETVPRVGYRFLIPVERVGAEPEPAPAPAEVPERIQTRSMRSRAWLLAGLAILLGSGVAVVAAYRFRAAQARNPSLVRAAAPLTSYLGSERYPGFSPDGTQVVFAWDGETHGGSHIYLIPAAGGGARRLTSGTWDDYGPVWSPDGGSIAFLRRIGEGKAEVRIAEAHGSGERKVADIAPAATDHPLTWTRDPRRLIISAMPGDGPAALFLLSTETGERRRITSPPMDGGEDVVVAGGDLSPVVSPDGRKLAFTRFTGTPYRDIFMVPLSSDQLPTREPVRVTDLNWIIDTLAWTADGRELIFSAAPTFAGSRFLFRVGADASTPYRHVAETGIEGSHPALSPDGATLAYVRNNIDQTSTWRLEIPENGKPVPGPTKLISSTRRDFTADISPDGKRLVFSSTRSGATNLWMSDIDGSNLKRITSMGATTPRWSPDGRRIVFESSAAGNSEIYIINPDTNAIERLTFHPAPDVRPSWSRDGKYVYFSSSRTGKLQIWKVPETGGGAIQVTHRGGAYAIESADGKTVLYTSTDQPAKVRRVPVDGGEEVEVIDQAAGYSGIALARDGLCYLSSLTSTGAKLRYYNLATGASRLIATIDHPLHHYLSSPPDGRSVVYTEMDQEDSDLMIVRLR